MSLVAKLEQRLAGALRHKDLAWSMPLIPAQYRDDGRVIMHLLSVAAEPIRGSATARRSTPRTAR